MSVLAQEAQKVRNQVEEEKKRKIAQEEARHVKYTMFPHINLSICGRFMIILPFSPR